MGKDDYCYMNSECLRFDTHGESLQLRLTSDKLGFSPELIWNPSPSTFHRTEPYPFPQTLRIGIQGNRETGAKFSPPPFAVEVESSDERSLLAVAADPGWHLWNEVVFDACQDGVSCTIDLEGHCSPADAAEHVRMLILHSATGESRHGLLARGLRCVYPTSSEDKDDGHPEWWSKPIYCGWGDQVSTSMWLEGPGPEPRALAYCLQGLYERWLRRLNEADVPIGSVIIDAGWSLSGIWEADTVKWPNLRGFIDRQHQAGRKVLLWIPTWLWDGLPDAWCVFAGDVKLTADPTHPDYLAFLRDHVAHLLSADGLDADGFKIDQLAYCPNQRRPRGGPRFGRTAFYDPPEAPIRLHGDGWGCELLYQLQKAIYDAAKNVKPGALITSSTVHPYFHDTFDMTRLHDTGQITGDVIEAMKARADLVRAVFPAKPIDADDWVHSNYNQWLRYTSGSRELGVPCLFYAERFMANWRTEPTTILIPLDDLRGIADDWRSAGVI